MVNTYLVVGIGVTRNFLILKKSSLKGALTKGKLLTNAGLSILPLSSSSLFSTPQFPSATARDIAAGDQGDREW